MKDKALMIDNGRPSRVYIDLNVVDDLAKEILPKESLKNTGVDWIYSNEHFTEIRRAGQNYFLDALSELGAKKLEPEVDQDFRVTDSLFLSTGDPHEFYQQWEQTTSDSGDVSELLIPFIARSFGAANDAEYAALPVSITKSIADILKSADVPSGVVSDVTAAVGGVFETITRNHMRERVVLEDLRVAMGTHGGRAGNLRNAENPLLDLWEIIRATTPTLEDTGPDAFFGFDPSFDYGYEHFPLFLGIVGCYTLLNTIGYRPDEKLSRACRTPGVMSDANHVAYAAYCDVLVSADKRMCEKASAIYRYKALPVTVVRIEKGKGG